MILRQQLPHYIHLMRLDKPIGTLLLLWPTLWALWLASHGKPDGKIVAIFMLGVLLMRSAGCVVNDFADRHIDSHITRTQNRPFATGKVTAKEVLSLAGVLTLSAFALVLMCNILTIKLAFIGVILAFTYPFMKRFTYFPQLGLGLAFTWGIPMAFAAQLGEVTFGAWVLYATGIIWPIIYDTIYAMVDRHDDLKIGVKSTAVLFDYMDKFMVGLLQTLFLAMLIIVGLIFRLHIIYYLSLILVAILFVFQQWLIRNRDPDRCFRAFLNNNWVGVAIFLGILLNYSCPHPFSYIRNCGDCFHFADKKSMLCASVKKYDLHRPNPAR